MQQIILFLLISLNLYSHNKNTSENHEININNNDETNQEQLIPVENIIHWKVKHKNQDTTIKFKINNYKWKWSWDQKSTIIGSPSQYSFFIKINGQLIEVYLPQSIQWQPFIGVFNNYIKIEYKINNVDYIFRSSIATKENHNNKEIFLKNNNNYPNEFYPLDLFSVETKNQNNIQIYKFFNKDKTKTLEIFFNPEDKIIEKYQINDKDFVFQEDVNKNIHLDLNQYPSNFSLIPNEQYIKIINSLANKISDKITCHIAHTYIVETNVNYPDFSEMISKVNHDKPYILIVVPIYIQTLDYEEIGNRYHIFPMGFLFEKFNEIWILKKIITTNTCLNQFIFINWYFINLINKILNNNQQTVKNSIENNQSIKNMIINKISFFTNGNTYSEMTDFIQTRQSGANSCYTSAYKDILRIVKYSHNLINNKEDILKDSLLTMKDLFQNFQIKEIYNKFDKKELHKSVKSLLIEYESNLALHNLNKNFIINLTIQNTKSFGPLINEHKVLYERQNLESLRKIYHIFFLKINNDIYSYLIYRENETKLDNKRYYTTITNAIKELYPNFHIHPFQEIPLKDFNKNHKDSGVITLLKFFNNGAAMPTIFKPLVDISGYINEPIKTKTTRNSLYLGSFHKSIVPDNISDSILHILFLITKSNGKEKQKIINILIEIMENK